MFLRALRKSGGGAAGDSLGCPRRPAEAAHRGKPDIDLRFNDCFITARSWRVNATPELIKETIGISAKCGADGTIIANYDTATPELMRAVREGFEEMGIEIRGK